MIYTSRFPDKEHQFPGAEVNINQDMEFNSWAEGHRRSSDGWESGYEVSSEEAVLLVTKGLFCTVQFTSSAAVSGYVQQCLDLESHKVVSSFI